jgi:hypothetical protein
MRQEATMEHAADTEVSATAWEALRQLSLGAGHYPIVEADAERLVSLGWAEHVSGGYIITPAGRAAIARHFDPAA